MQIFTKKNWDKESVWVIKESHCEHCGELEPYTPVYCDEFCTWCLNCYGYKVSSEIQLEALKISYPLKAKYYLKSLNDCLKLMGVEQVKVEF